MTRFREDIKTEVLIKMYVSGLGCPEISEIVGCHKLTVRNRLKQADIVFRSTKEAIKLATQRDRFNPNISNKGKRNGRWKGGRLKRHDGYIKVLRPNYPRAHKDGYVLEHILIWEEAHGQSLPKGWVIHHLNGIRDDNRSVNLVAMPRRGHSKHEESEAFKKRIRQLEAEVRVLKESQQGVLV